MKDSASDDNKLIEVDMASREVSQQRPESPQSGVPAAAVEACVVVDAHQQTAGRADEGSLFLTSEHWRRV